VHVEPSAYKRQLQLGATFSWRALQFEDETPIDFFDVDSAILDRLDRFGDLNQLARRSLGIGIGRAVSNFIGYLPS
jgi:hypothetical protein